jgi:hypothetical protein
MRLLRYAIFCIVVLIVSVLIRRPDDMPTKEMDIVGKGTAVVEKVKSFFPSEDEKEKGTAAETGKKEADKSDKGAAEENEDDEEDDDTDEDLDEDE